MRTIQEIYRRMNELKAAWKEMEEKAIESRDTMKEVIFWQLVALYWALGNSEETAMDKASLLMGDDPIDWS